MKGIMYSIALLSMLSIFGLSAMNSPGGAPKTDTYEAIFAKLNDKTRDRCLRAAPEDVKRLLDVCKKYLDRQEKKRADSDTPSRY